MFSATSKLVTTLKTSLLVNGQGDLYTLALLRVVNLWMLVFSEHFCEREEPLT